MGGGLIPRRLVGASAIAVAWACAVVAAASLRGDGQLLGDAEAHSRAAATAPASRAALHRASDPPLADTVAQFSYACLEDCDCTARTRVVLGGLDIM